MSMGLQGVELNYLSIDKQSFAVFKVIKHFRPYILKSHKKVIDPHLFVRSFLILKERRDKRKNWLTSLQEYDLETNPTKVVKGQCMCKLASETLDPHDDEEGWENEGEMLKKEIIYIPASTNSWYNYLKYYLTHGSSPRHLDS